MRSKELYYFLLLFLFGLVSCTKEPNPGINTGLEPDHKAEPIPQHYIKTGESNHDSIIYTKFEPALYVKGENLYEGDGYEHRDSLFLDVNHDGAFDLRFDYRDWYYESDCPEDTISNDSVIVCCFPDAFNSCRVECISEIELLCMMEMDYRPLPLVDSIVLNDYKYTDPDNNDYYLIQGFVPEDSFYWKSKECSGIMAWPGLWDSWDSQESHYLGFRFPTSDTSGIHGWISLSCKGTTCIEIYDMAIEK